MGGGGKRRGKRVRTRRTRPRRTRRTQDRDRDQDRKRTRTRTLKNLDETLREAAQWVKSLRQLNQRIFDQRIEKIRQDLARRKIKDQKAAKWAKELSELYDKWRRSDILDYTTARRINELRKKLGQPPQFLEDTMFYLRREGPIMGKRGQIREIVDNTLGYATAYLALYTPFAAIEAIERLAQEPPILPHEQLLAAVDLQLHAQDLYWHGKRIRENARMLSEMADEVYKDQSIPKRQRAELASMIIDRAKELYDLADDYIETGLDLMGE